MLFPTITFAIFFAVVFALHWLIRRWSAPWKIFMLGASLFFYGWWDARFVSLIGFSIVANWAVAVLIARTQGTQGERTTAGRALLASGVALNLGILGWFKYYGFFTTEVASSLAQIGVELSPPLIEVTLPVGVSFFTFQAISYVVDVSRGQFRALGLLDFAVYLSFFPQLVAGPIVRAPELAPQLAAPPTGRFVETSEAFRLILAGLFKKVVISSYLATEIVDPVYGVPEQHSSAEILFATYAYAMQIYADFSGYTDIAIGCALLLGLRLPQNFNQPYRAATMQEFWRRWHMTLSRWLRDYLYIPLGGSRGGKLFTYRNLMLTMLLGGLWHGAAWTFVIWGGLLGGVLVVERVAQDTGLARRLSPKRAGAPGMVLAWLLTFHLVCLAWVFFRAESLDLALTLLERLFTAGGEAPLVTPLVVAVIAGMLAVQFVPARAGEWLDRALARMPVVSQAAALGVGLFMIDRLGPEGVAPFIYFQF